MSMDMLHSMNGAVCSCGKEHRFASQICSGAGAIREIPRYVPGKHVFVLSDVNTFPAAGQKVCTVLEDAGISHSGYSFPQTHLEPDEASVGAACMHFDPKADMIVAVGSGVINDIGKILSNLTGKPYMIVATAPSMDGYASASSSMTRDGLKISLPSRCADVIVGDTDILCQAPLHMMKAGLGDMIAKYVSICEWRISNLITGEYYCPKIAELIRSAVKTCTSHAKGLLSRDPNAVQAVFEGLVIGGVAMNYAGLSRPASGVEHYISHVVDMRAVEFGTAMDLHGIQCAIGTRIAVSLYEKLKSYTPDRQKALDYAAAFDKSAWESSLRRLLGKGAESMIALEERERKYDLDAHRHRLDTIIKQWDKLLWIIRAELPYPEELDQLLRAIGAPKTLSEIGVDETLLPEIFRATKDIRDKYVLSRLAWDLGILEELV